MKLRSVSLVIVALALAGAGTGSAAEEAETPLDRALAEARDGEEARGRFYDLFLETELLVPLAPETDPPPAGEERHVEGGETIRLFVASVEGVPTAYAFDTPLRLGTLRAPNVTTYVRAPGRDLVTMLPPEVQLVLNLNAPQSKLLSAEELEWLRGRPTGAAPAPAPPREVDSAESAALELLAPGELPAEVVEALRALFAERPAARSAWLAHGRPKGSAEPPHLVIGIEADGDAKPLIDAAAPVVARILPDGEYADFFEMGRDRLSKSMRKRGSAIYTRGD